jgi:hypothetical protein
MPSPMMLSWPLRSFTSLTGPRLMPMRTWSSGSSICGIAIASRRLRLANSASSGSPRKLSAAPSPVSRMTRSLGATSDSASARNSLSRSLRWLCSETGFSEYATMSRNTTLQMTVRLLAAGTMGH